MRFNEYQNAALQTADYPDLGRNLLYPALGLAGEAGEVAEKVKKHWRDRGITSGLALTYDQRMELAKEASDCLWYVAALAHELGIPMETIAQANLDKLSSRKARNVIHGEGDNR